jgi:hypothetical protein
VAQANLKRRFSQQYSAGIIGPAVRKRARGLLQDRRRNRAVSGYDANDAAHLKSSLALLPCCRAFILS